MKRKNFLSLFVLILTVLPLLPYAQKRNIKCVVIDAGHGGKDQGCHGHGAKEKDVCLEVALKLGAYIESYMPDVKVVYTRKEDVFIPLSQRAAIANKNRADLYVSIHANASGKTFVHGTETYIFGPKTYGAASTFDEATNETVERENQMALEFQEKKEEKDKKKKKGDGQFDEAVLPGKESMKAQKRGFEVTEAYSPSSYSSNTGRDIAQRLERQYRFRADRHSRGVKRAYFVVLRETRMPAILTEIGFLTNKEEAAYLQSPRGVSHTASAIFRTIRDYQEGLDGYVYAVQLMSADSPQNIEGPLWRSVKNLKTKEIDQKHKYYSVGYRSKKEARKAAKQYDKQGFKGAFIIKWKG